MFCKSLKQKQVEKCVVILNCAVIRWIKVNSCDMLVLPKGKQKQGGKTMATVKTLIPQKETEVKRIRVAAYCRVSTD